jgi:hypothetical protein
MPGRRELRDHEEDHVGDNNGISIWHIPPVFDDPDNSEL